MCISKIKISMLLIKVTCMTLFKYLIVLVKVVVPVVEVVILTAGDCFLSFLEGVHGLL